MNPSQHNRLAPLSLKANFAWTLAGNLTAAFSQWLLLVILTKTTSDATTGQFVLAMSICAPVFMFAGLDLRTLQATDSDNSFEFHEYLTLRVFCGVLALLAVPGITWAIGYRGETLLIISGVALGRLFDVIADIFYGLMQKSERMDRVSRSLVIRGVCSAVAFCVAIAWTGNLVTAVFLATGVRLAVLLAVDLPVALSVERKPVRFGKAVRVDWPRLMRLAVLGLPLAVKVMLVSLNVQVTRYFVIGMCSLAEVGVFGPIAALAVAGTTISKALNQSVSARLGRLARNQQMVGFRNLLRKMRLLYLGLGIAGVTAAWLFGETLLAIVYRPDFAAYYNVLTLVAVAVALQLQSGILDMAMVALRRITVLPILSGVSVAVTSIACWLLIPIYGIEGAAMAMIISRIVRMAALNVLISLETRTPRAEKTEPNRFPPVSRHKGRKAA